MSRCQAMKANGEACKGTATGSHGYCWAHAPENAEQRRRAASKAARSKPNKEIRDFKQEVKTLIDDVKSGDQDRADAAVVLQGYRVLKDYIELERKIREADELAARIEELERDINRENGGKRWAT